ncbi:GNAT family N-acetyltransferase [Thermodesulfobacteriota bacterium]
MTRFYVDALMEKHRSFIRKALNRILSAFVLVSRQWIFRFEFDRDVAPEILPPEDVHFHLIGMKSLDAMASWPGRKFLSSFRKFINQGQTGHYISLGNEVVFYHWCKIKIKPFAFSCFHEIIQDGTVLLHRGNAREGYRNVGFGTYGNLKTIEYFREDPRIKRIDAAVEPKNIPSQKLFLKCGFHKVQRFTLVILLTFIHIHFIHDIEEDGKTGPLRLRLSIKTPLWLWSPLLFNRPLYKRTIKGGWLK